MAEPTCTIHELRAEEARKLIKRQPAGTNFAVHLHFNSPIEGEPGRVFPDGCSGILTVSKKEALKLPANLLSKTLEDRGGRIRIKLLAWPGELSSLWCYIGG